MRGDKLLALVLLLVPSGAAAEENAALPEKYARPVLGIGGVDVPDEPIDFEGVRDYRWPTRKGLLVRHCNEQTEAGRQGLSLFDVIYRVNKKRVANSEDFVEAISALKPGDDAKVYFYDVRIDPDRLVWRRRGAEVPVMTYYDYLRSVMREEEVEPGGPSIITHANYNKEDRDTGMGVRLFDGPMLAPVIQLRWKGSRWLFVDRVNVVINGKPHPIPVPISTRSSDNTAYTCWEWYSVSTLNDETSKPVIDAVYDLADATDVTVHYYGDSKKDRYELKFSEVVAAREVADYYLARERIAAGE